MTTPSSVDHQAPVLGEAPVLAGPGAGAPRNGNPGTHCKAMLDKSLVAWLAHMKAAAETS